MRFRSQLLILVLSVLIPGFLAAIVAVWYVYSEEQQAQEKGLQEATRVFSRLIETELRSREGILQTLARSPVLRQGDLREFYDFAKSMAPGPETTIILVNTNNEQLLNTRAPFGAEIPKQRASNLVALMERHGADRTLVSDVFFAPVGKRFDFTLQVPVLQDGRIRYYLVMGINASALQPLMTQQGFPREWLATVVDRQGVVVTRSREPERFIGRQASESTRKSLFSATEGVFRSVTLDNIPVKTFFSRVALSDWTVIISIPESELRRAPLRVAAFLALMLAGLLGFALLAARRIAGQVVERMERLGESADRLGQGQAVEYRPQGLTEIDAVGARIADASRQIRRNKQELEQRVAEAVANTERAQRALLHSQKLEALGRLTGGIAHEFNNLLQTLTTALQLARMISTQERVQSLIDTCNKAVQRATSLTGQLSAFGRIQDARLETVALSRHVSVFEQLVENILPSNVTLETRVPDGLWPVTLDPTQLELALINLVINARDAMPAGGSITIEACNETLACAPDGLAAGDYLHIRVADTGLGMSPEVMARALDPFFTTKDVGKGSGLGLPQAYGFARQSGGTLLLHSTEGRGTAIDIYLPRAAAKDTVQPAPETASTAVQPARGALLFVEDDPLVREAVIPALEDAGYTVLRADSVEAALSLLDGGATVDAVFSDIVMPGRLSGVDLARAVVERYPHVRVVLATGYSEQRIALPGVQLLSKPYDFSEALRALAETSAG
ncbi:ATP-binding protein [Noviherbaspirillum aridicola]|uniref:histidine kinase n=1 Tax=Noviherbaspirillum aridicola TaxID=2849687 RepID=A0ABQ4QA70_9BURK|nr:ATP-binding protein [Noviherbaspirillum aridicola]GIZ53949.1 hypothetical protein NCCP691_39630 [Noviherbaspirillum aridicola]